MGEANYTLGLLLGEKCLACSTSRDLAGYTDGSNPAIEDGSDGACTWWTRAACPKCRGLELECC